MATKAIKTPLLRTVTKRSYSSQALPICGTISDIKTTVLPNKMVISSAENGSPIARLSIVFRAGSRYESLQELGVAHVLRAAAGLSTKNATQFAIMRNLQQVGANLTCIGDRETIAYNLEGTYGAVERASEFLSEVASQQVFKPWEVKDLSDRIQFDLATRSPQVKAVNFLHKVAFRNGIGNSLFCAKHKIGNISSESLQHYVCNNFTTNRVAVVGLGVNHEQLVKYAQNLCLETGEGAKTTPSCFTSGEIRKEKGGCFAYVALGTEGAALANEKESVSFAVLQRAFGIGPYAKFGNESSGLLAKAIAKNTDEIPVAISALNASYSDTGLFGFVLAAHVEKSREVILEAVKALKSGSVSESDLIRGKNQLKTAVLLDNESGGNFIEVMGNQAALLGAVKTPEQIVAAVDAVTLADVKKAAEKVKSGKLSIASVGNISRVPYLDELA